MPITRAVREAHAALVEQDQPGEAGKPLHETAVARQLPVRLQVREPAHDEDQVDVALAQHLVGDVDVVGARVADFGERVIHAASIPPASDTRKMTSVSFRVGEKMSVVFAKESDGSGL